MVETAAIPETMTSTIPAPAATIVRQVGSRIFARRIGVSKNLVLSAERPMMPRISRTFTYQNLAASLI